jgi:hypothetical protein
VGLHRQFYRNAKLQGRVSPQAHYPFAESTIACSRITTSRVWVMANRRTTSRKRRLEPTRYCISRWRMKRSTSSDSTVALSVSDRVLADDAHCCRRMPCRGETGARDAGRVA